MESEKQASKSCEQKLQQNKEKEITTENSQKRARQFDLSAMFQQTLESARQNYSGPPSELHFIEDALHKSASEHGRRLSSTLRTDDVIDEDVGPALPPNFKLKDSHFEEEDDFGPSMPAGFVPDKSVLLQDDEEEGFFEQITASSLIPATCEILVDHGRKPVTAATLDLQGTKFSTGCYGYSVNMYEFLKMDASMKFFRQLYPCESHVINDLAFSNNGETLLIGSGNPQIKLLDRQGKQWAETVRGDQYLVDLSNTKGHTAAVNCVCWHPLNKTEFLTCSDDGTLRIWDISDFKELTKIINTQRKVIKTKNASGKRAIPTTCCYSRDGKLIAAGCDDGSIQIWKNGKIFVNTTYMNRGAHKGSVTKIQFSPNNKRIVSRSLDDTLKLFDLESFNKPLAAVEGLDTAYPQTDCGYSPHAEFIFTATSFKAKGKESGSLLFFDSENLDLLNKIIFSNQGCIRVLWHPKINQILATLSDGTCRIYYDPSSSVRGALQCVSRPVRRSRQAEIVREDIILSPLTLEMFQPRGEEGEEKEVTEWRIRKFLRMQNNSKKPQFRKPADNPMNGPSAGGRVAKSGGTLHSYIAKQLGTDRNKDFIQDEDVRASILRHAEEAEKDPQFVGKAYKRTQPVTIYQDPSDETEEEESDKGPHYKASKLS